MFFICYKEILICTKNCSIRMHGNTWRSLSHLEVSRPPEGLHSLLGVPRNGLHSPIMPPKGLHSLGGPSKGLHSPSMPPKSLHSQSMPPKAFTHHACQVPSAPACIVLSTKRTSSFLKVNTSADSPPPPPPPASDAADDVISGETWRSKSARM